MERRMRGNSHVRCGAGENPAMTSKDYLSQFKRTHDGQYQAVADEDENGFTAAKAVTFLQSVYAPTFTPAP